MSLLSTIGTGLIGNVASNLTENKTPTSTTESFKSEMTAVDKFLKYQEMTQAEKIRASYLAKHGITEEELAAMSPEERQKVEQEILEDIKRQIALTEVRKNAG